MNKKYKYSVVTSIFNNYENVKEIEHPVDDVEYVIVTNNPNLQSKTWKIRVFEDYDKLPYPELDWIYVKFFTFKYCTTDICLYIDGSIQIKKDFTDLINYFVNNKYEYAITLDNHTPTAREMLNHLADNNLRGYNRETADKVIAYLTDKGYNLDGFGLTNSSFILKQNTSLTEKIDKFTWETMCNYQAGPLGFRLMEPALDFSLHTNAYHDSRIMVLDYNIKWSPWFQWHYHKTDISLSFYINRIKTYHDADCKWVFQNNLIKFISYNDIVCKKQPLLTVVITVYNKESTIKRAINCVKTMSYSNWECIIVDNDSQDNSTNVIMDSILDDERFVYVKQRNKNLCNSRNVGAFLGKGKYLIHLDGDDTLGKYFCEYAIAEMEKNDNICISTGWFKRVHVNNYFANYFTIACDFNSMNYKKRTNIVLKINPFPVESVLRMSTFRNCGAFREGTEHTSEDTEMYVRYMYESKEKNDVYFIYDECTTVMYEQVLSKSKTEVITSFNFAEQRYYNYTLNKKIYEEFCTSEEIEDIKNKKFLEGID